tara:strand:- start:978 stop:1253 length:276 start_codon:yes stop_codon:yes gene_type:complete
MSLTKETIIDKIQTVKVENWFNLEVRENTQISENGNVISENLHRYRLLPDHDVSTISDPVVLAQFNAVMTDEVKQHYQNFLEAQNAQMNPE